MQYVRYFGLLLFSLAVLYATAFALSYVAFPGEREREVDVLEADDSLYFSQPKYLLFTSARLPREGSRVLVVGSSNSGYGFRPGQIAPRIGEMEVDNLAVANSNMHQIQEIVALAYSRIPRSSWNRTTFVLGLFYGALVDDARNYPPDAVTPLDTERLRYGLYEKSRRGDIVPAVSPRWIGPAQLALRPFLFASWLYERVFSERLNEVRIAVLRAAGQDAPQNNVARESQDNSRLTAAQRLESLSYWRDLSGPDPAWDRDGWATLADLAHLVSSRGGRLIILDLPLPRWHTNAIAQFRRYQIVKQEHLSPLLKLNGVSYASMQGQFSDDDFYDSVHPRPRVTSRWADLAALAILRTQVTATR